MKTHEQHKWMGVFAATMCPFNLDESIDFDGLSAYIKHLLQFDQLKGLVPNGHTGEIMSLRLQERAEVTRIVKREVLAAKRNIPVVSGICSEGSLPAIDDAFAAAEAGADAILLMPLHHWMRFGKSKAEVVGFFKDLAAVGLPIIVHQYPAWTKAGYSLDEMKELVEIPEVVCIKMGTRDMARWLFDYEELKKKRSDLSIITCHDEYLLPTLLEAGDGALVGFAGFAPQLIIELVHACLDGNYYEAKKSQKSIEPLARIIYQFGEPSNKAHQRMKTAKWLLGEISSPVFRRPIQALEPDEINELRFGLDRLGYNIVN